MALLVSALAALTGCRRVSDNPEPAPEPAAADRAITLEVERKADAAPAARTAHKPLLWEVVAPGGARSHILGTMHLGFDYEDLPPVVWQRLGDSTSVVLELDPRQMSPAVIRDRTQLPPGQSLRALVGEAAWPKVQAAAAGVPDAMLDRLQPWVVAQMVLARLHPTVLPLDLAVLRDAEKGGKQLVFLETLDFQLGLIGEVMDAKALVEMVDDDSRERRLLAATVAAYQAGDVDELSRVALDPANFADRPGVAERFLFARNRDWVPKLTPLFDKGGAFVAVGAAHLLGDRGLVKLLTDKGYRVTRVVP